MRSRTELVTTTFIDSEEDETESDDSEEDWRPDSCSRNDKKQKPKSRRTKRKLNSNKLLLKKRKTGVATSDRDELDSGDDPAIDNTSISYEQNVQTITTTETKPLSQKAIAEQSMPDKSGVFQLYLYKNDLDMDYKTNIHLCLWRRDGSSLLQKYIRVRTNSEEFIFTSSSVYSSWDDKRRKDFATIAVKCLAENNRRVTLLDVSELHSMAENVIRCKQLKIKNSDGEGSKKLSNAHDREDDDDDDDNYSEDESEDCTRDLHSAKSSEDDDEIDSENGSNSDSNSD